MYQTLEAVLGEPFPLEPALASSTTCADRPTSLATQSTQGRPPALASCREAAQVSRPECRNERATLLIV